MSEPSRTPQGCTDHPRVLILDPSQVVLTRVVHAMAATTHECRIDHVDDLAGALTQLTGGTVDVVLADLATLVGAGLVGSLLRMISADPHAAVILLCDDHDEATACEGIRSGADDYLRRGHDGSEHMLRTIVSAFRRRVSRAQIRYDAYHDALTGLPNRAVLEACAASAEEHGERPAAVLSIGLDHFGRIEAIHGSEVAHRALRLVAGRVLACVSQVDLLARTGGDQFAVLLDDVQAEGDAVQLAGRVLTAIERPIQLDGRTIRMSCSIGIALQSRVSRQHLSLMRAAEVARDQAGDAGPGTVRLFRGAAATQRALALSTQVDGALERGELDIAYQPQVGPGDCLVGVEALLRWYRPRGAVPPDAFVPLLEASGAIVEVGRWVLQQSLHQLTQWHKMGIAVPRVSVNVSPLQFADPHLADDVFAALDASDLAPSALELEVTERIMMSDHPNCARNLQRIRAGGVGIALDDFGTGYASLGYLHRYPIDTLKVDRSFIDGLTRDPKVAAIVEGILDLTRRLGLVSVAEGVETPEQAEFLRSRGCHVLQGYLFGRPRSGAVAPFRAFLGHRAPAPNPSANQQRLPDPV